MSSSGDERPWVTSAGAPAATILPGRATWMMRRGEALLAAWEAEAHDEVAPPSAAEIIAGTVSGLVEPASSPSDPARTIVPTAAALTVPAAPSPSADDVVAQLHRRLDQVIERLATQVADFELDMRRTGEELRGTVAEHRSEVRSVREDLGAVREWMQQATEARPSATTETPGRVLVDPRRLLAGIAARVGLPAAHLDAVQGWAARDHRAVVEVAHPGARRRLGVVAAAYGATLGYRVCVLVPRPSDAVAWRTDLAAHAPGTSVAGPDDLAVHTSHPDVALTTDPARATAADLVVVSDLARRPAGILGTPGTVTAPRLLGLAGRGDAAAAAASGLPVLGPV
jgi:hypothetical protein